MTSLSVLLPTHNGADTIDRTLAAMAALESPPGGWTLTVINNASTDDTERRVLAWRDRLPLDYVLESRLGKSFALNAGLGRATGDLVVMTDDDVLPDRNWLTEWRRVADAYPQCAAFGGTIVPHFDEGGPSSAVSRDSYSILYAETPNYPEGEIISTREAETLCVFGPNMAVRRYVSAQGFRFREDFLVGSNGLMGEDSDYMERIQAAGFGIGFAPTAMVGHIVQKEQITWWWIQSRFFRHGRAIYMREDVAQSDAYRPMERLPARWRLRRLVRRIARLPLAVIRRDRERCFTLFRAIAYDLGALKQAWLLREVDVVIALPLPPGSGPV